MMDSYLRAEPTDGSPSHLGGAKRRPEGDARATRFVIPAGVQGPRAERGEGSLS